MMTSLAQNFQPHPGGMQQHPGVPQGHPMAVPHNPNQGQPGPGMPQQMHMGVSGPGPQVSQAGAMMGGMPPGVGGPSAHALQHLNPGQAQQAQFLQQQQQMFANNPQMQQMHQQQQIIHHQRQQAAARQAMIAQQYSGIPQGMPAGMNQLTQAQYQAMRGAGPMTRPVNLPQHLQQQQAQAQQQAQHNMEQQQAAQAQQQHQQQQMLVAQQMALQHQANQGGGNIGQSNQLTAQQMQNMQQIAAQQQAQQQQQQQHAANQQNQQAQNQGQQPQPNQQPQTQGQQPAQGQPGLQQQQAAAQVAMMQQRQQQQQQQQQQADRLKGQYLLKIYQFNDSLSKFPETNTQGDLSYWITFVEKFFSRIGVFRHSLWFPDESTNKQYEVTFPALARYFHTHFESGVTRMQMIMEQGTEKELPPAAHLVESGKTSFIYHFDTDSQFVANGSLKVLLDHELKIELLEFITHDHKEFYPLRRVIEAARPVHDWQKEWHKVNATPDGKSSPEMNKKKQKALKSPQTQPPDIDLPRSKVSSKNGITASVFRFLEFAEVMGQMNPLFHYSHNHKNLAPYTALDAYVAEHVTAGKNATGASPAIGNLQLPGSPHITGSPAQAPGMLPQHSQHGTNSSGPSANTSPNTSNKRRRPSTVKAEEDVQVNGTPQTKAAVKPSPRIGGKRQKGNPA